MELSLPHTLHLFNTFHENDGKENCDQFLEEECIKMFFTRSLYDEHYCNVVSMNSLKISKMLMMIAQVMTKMFLISMSISAECINFVKTCLIGKIDFARSINMIEPILCSK